MAIDANNSSNNDDDLIINDGGMMSMAKTKRRIDNPAIGSESAIPPVRNAYDHTNVLSQLYACYVFPFMWRHYRNDDQMNLHSFEKCSKRDECQHLGDRLRKRWENELARGPNKASLLRATFSTFRWPIILQSILNITIYGIIRMLMPIFLGRFVHYANVYRENFDVDSLNNQTVRPITGLEWLDDWTVSDQPFWNAIFFATLLSMAILMNFLLSHPHFMENFRIGMHFRVALTRLVYEKSLRVTSAAVQRMTIGKIVNLISNDASRFDPCFTSFYFLYGAFIHCIIAMIFLYFYIGTASFAAIILVVFYIPFQTIMANILSKFRSKSILLTDDRLRLMAEILPAMRVIKMYCWEKPFAALVNQARKLEINKIRHSMILRSINLATFFVANKLMTFACIIWFLDNGQVLTAETVFVSISLIYQIRESMTFFFPMAVSYTVECYISLKRIEKFLLQEEKTMDQTTGSMIESGVEIITLSKKNAPGGDRSIQLDSVTVKSAIDGTAILTDITFTAEPGKLTVIVGQVGSGKSAILLTILRELTANSGTVKVNGTVSYASQEAWIFAGTVQQNILFGRPYDSKRYLKVIKVSALETDLEQMPNGDRTMVEDRGTSLSGGQRARLSLARALYSDSDGYLLDDPLSAVDTAVAKHIFEECIKKYLKSKTVILATHQLQFIKQADQIVVLKNGQCLAVGSYPDLLKRGIDIYKYAATEPTVAGESGGADSATSNDHIPLTGKTSLTLSVSHPAITRLTSSPFTSELFVRSRTSSVLSTASSLALDDAIMPDYVRFSIVPGDLTGEESAGSTLSSKKIYWTYIRMGAGAIMLAAFLLSNLLCQVLYTGTDYWISAWTDYQESKQWNKLNPEHEIIRSGIIVEDDQWNVIIYSSLTAALFLFAIIRTVTFFVTCMRSSVNLHNTIFSSLIETPISFFDRTPVGVILNRLSRDLNIIDDILPVAAFEAWEILGNSLAVFILCTTVNAFILIPFFLFAIVLYFDVKFYVNTARNIKRMEAAARSPLFSQLSGTLAGLPTIRSYRAQQMFLEKFTDAQNVHSSTMFTFLSASRLFGISMEIMCLIYIYVLVWYLALNMDIFTGSIIGLMISQSLSLTSSFNWGVRQLTEVETFMTSVERIIEFGKLDKENLDHGEIEPPEQWPQRGDVTYDNVSLCYNDGDPPVLKNLSFNVPGGEKIGIVGRTGAGKSSIIVTLFRLTQPTGTIYIDGIDTGRISLQALRKNLSIIPQEPVMFSGNIRRNLDPFNEKSDEELWDAVEKVELKHKISSFPEKLDSPVSECGNDFSVGQKQLICLARAILRRNRILVLDEATANVDPRTDSLIQETIRTEFKHCTVLTIAHRLNTIIDYDRILVLDKGELKQFDTPYNLIQLGSGIFYELYANVAEDVKAELKRLAKLSHERYMAARRRSSSTTTSSSFYQINLG